MTIIQKTVQEIGGGTNGTFFTGTSRPSQPAVSQPALLSGYRFGAD